MSKLKHKKTALFLAGLIGSTGFAPIYALPFFAAALIFAVFMCDKANTYRQAALTGYTFGFGFFAASFYWIANALLVDAATFGFLYPFALMALGAFFGLFFVPSFMVWHTFKNTNFWYRILAFSALFVLMEYVRTFLFTGFPWNMIGTMFAFWDILLQSASLVGTYGLSFVMLVLVFCFYAAIKKHQKSAVITFALIVTSMILFGFWRINHYNPQTSDIKIRLVQPSIEQNLKWDQDQLEDNLITYINMSRKINIDNDDVNLVIWGETATAFNPNDSLYYKMLIRQAVPLNGYLITGVLRYDEQNDKLYNSMSVINDEGETVAFYDKNHLVPFGEYIPFRQILPKWIKPVANQIADFSTGEKYKKIKLKNLPEFGALICYEVIFPNQVLDRKHKPSFLVVVSNDGWYGNSAGPYQHLVSAQMRAVEEGITIIRSANNGISALINPLGQITGKIGLNEISTIDIAMPEVLTLPTIYAAFGSKIVLIILFLLLAALFCAKFKFYNSEKSVDFLV